jgi:hypothetical protein
MAQVSIQNLPLEVIAEISNHLNVKDFVNFSSTCKEYKELFDKETKECKKLDKAIKGISYYKVSVVMNPELTYVYYIYVLDENIDLYKRNHNHKLLNKFVGNNEVVVVLKPEVYLPESCESIEKGEFRKMKFESFLYYICRSFLSYYRECSEILDDEVYDMGRVMVRVLKIIDTYKYYGAIATLNLIQKYCEQLDVGSSIRVQKVVNW